MIYVQNGVKKNNLEAIKSDISPLETLYQMEVQTYKDSENIGRVKKELSRHFFSGEFKSGIIRNDANVLYRDLIVIDIEETGLNNAELLKKLMRLNDYNSLLYPSISHTREKPRYRLVIEPNRVITTKGEYKTNIRRIMGIVGVNYDKNSEIFSHLQALPIKREADKVFTVYKNSGKPWKVITASVEDDKKEYKSQIINGTTNHDEAIEIMANYVKNERANLQERNSYYVSNILVLAKAVVSGELEYHTALQCSEILADGNPKWQEENQNHLNRELKLANGNLAYFKNKYTFKSRFKDTQNKVISKVFGSDEIIKIDLDDNGKPYKTLTNFEKMLRSLYLIRYNEFTKEIEINNQPIDNKQIELIRYAIDEKYKTKIKKDDLKTIIVIASERNKYHPIKDILTASKWDGVQRAETFFIRHLGVLDTFVHRELTRKWLLACVNRIFNPGCKFDEMIILQGGQGIGKSTSLEKLSMNYFVKLNGKIDPKETALKTMKSWLVEVEELASFKGISQEILKSWVGSRIDTIRIPYETSYKDVPRQFCILGTTNENEFLTDRTGNRRYWVLKCADKIEEIKEPIFNIDDRYILQIWAEVYTWYLSNESLVPSKETLKEVSKIQGNFLEYDELTEDIESLLSAEFPVNWVNIFYSDSKYKLRIYAVDVMAKGYSELYKNQEKSLIKDITTKEINFFINNEEYGKGTGQSKNMKKINKHMKSKRDFKYTELKRGLKRTRGYKRE